MTEEDIIQINLMLWFNHNYPDVLIHHSPNGGSRHGGEAIKLKRMGVHKGWPDIEIPEYRLFIELKTKTGRLSKDQKETLAELKRIGYDCHVCHGFESAKEVILKKVKK